MKRVKSTPGFTRMSKRQDITEWNKHNYARIAPVGQPNENRFEMVDKPAQTFSQ